MGDTLAISLCNQYDSFPGFLFLSIFCRKSGPYNNHATRIYWVNSFARFWGSWFRSVMSNYSSYLDAFNVFPVIPDCRSKQGDTLVSILPPDPPQVGFRPCTKLAIIA